MKDKVFVLANLFPRSLFRWRQEYSSVVTVALLALLFATFLVLLWNL